MVAGAGPAVDFAPAAVTAVHRYSGGVPRLINMLCEGAMVTAEAGGGTSITPKVVDTAAARLEFRPVRGVSSASPWSRKPAGLAAAAVLLLALMGAAYMSLRSGASEMPAAPPAAGVPNPQRNTSVSPPVEAPPATASTPEATGATATPPADGSTFSVLVASFRQANEATALLSELKSRGLPVREVRVVSSPRGLWHQVLVGPYPDAEAAARGRDLVRQIRAYADAQVVSG